MTNNHFDDLVLDFSSDLNPVLQAANATLELRRMDNKTVRHVSMREFFRAYRQIAMTDDEVLVAVHIPLPKPAKNWFIHAYKQARRRTDDIGIVSAGLQVQLESVESEHGQWRIVSSCFSFGGMAPTTIMLTATQNELIGQFWTKSTIVKACRTALKELTLNDMTPGGQPEYR